MASADQALYFRLLGYVKPYWKVFALAVLGMVGIAATEPVFPGIMKFLLDQGFRSDDAQLAWLIPMAIIGLFVVRSLLVYLSGYSMMWISSRVVTDLRRAIFARLITLPTAYFDQHSAAQTISRLVYDVSQVSEAATSALVTLVRESLTASALLCYLLYLDWKLTLITLTMAPAIAFTVRSFGKRMRTASQRSLQSMRLIAHVIEESVKGHKVVKAFGGQAQQLERFADATEQFRRAQMREAVPASATTPITHIAAATAVALITHLALSQTTGNAGASAGGFVSFITAMLLVIAPLKQLTTISTTLQKGLAAAESVFSLLDAPAEADRGTRRLDAARGELVFERVRFRYPQAERMALDDISFIAQAGKTIALVGASGGGKSTIGALIPRFYATSEGRILIDGIDIQELALAELRHNIALVSQDVVLFNDTVASNIAYGSLGRHSREDIVQAAKAAHAWEFIEKMPQGIDTPIGENGARLSGGQRQRIAIARALLRNAPILILDEATSALDTESERQVQAALTTLMSNRTTLVIAHRLSTIEHADQILVLEQGRIVERGTHVELLGLGGYYANLIRIQT